MTEKRKKIISKVIASGMLVSNMPIQTFANEIEDVLVDASNVEGNINQEEINNSEILDIDDKTEIIDLNELENEDTISLDTEDIKDIKKSTITKTVVDNKYIINSLDELKQLRTEINTNNLDTTGIIVELGADIDFVGETSWEAIGTSTNGFKGVFNGNGYTLKNLNLNGVNFEGIFSNTGESTFKNVNINNFSIINSGTAFVGALVGISNANINFESINLSNIQIDASNSNYAIGGIIAFNPNGKTTNFIGIEANNIVVNGNTASYVGGIIGYGSANFKDIKASVEVTSLKDAYTGGLIGNDGSKISKPLEFENIILDLKLNGSTIGGLIGACTSNELNIKNVLITGESIEGSNTGGLVGYYTTAGTFENVEIKVKHISGGYTGGLIGLCSTTINLNNIEVSTNILGNLSSGGLIGLSMSQNIIGRNIKIKETVISSQERSGGIAGYSVGNSELSDLELEVIISGKGASGGIYGSSSGILKVKNAQIKANIDSSENIGGIVGVASQKVELIDNNIDVIINGTENLGGLVGLIYEDSNISNNNVKVTISGEKYIGGLIGYITSTSTITSNNTIDCNLNGINSVGGLIGYGANNPISNNKITGNIKGYEKIGGIAGQFYIYRNNLISQNDIQANIIGDNYVGGILGYSYGINSENNLILSEIKGNTNVSGITGGIEANSNAQVVIKSTVIASKIISENANILFGEYSNEGLLEVVNVYYDKEITPINDEYATGLKTSQMKGKESLKQMNLDFKNIWKANKETYPMFEQLNSAPDIMPNNKVVNLTITINQYDEFNPLDYVTTEDFEGDEVTVSIKNTKEKVDTSKYGIFPITIVATDSKGLSSELTLNLKINPLVIKLNEAPVIVAEDITLTVGDDFNPSKAIIAVDKEDGIITDSVKIIENTININKTGVYKVTYEVTDKDGAKTTKTITVTVKEKEVVSNNNSGSASTTDKDTNITEKPQTSDVDIVGLFGILISTIGLCFINRKKED